MAIRTNTTMPVRAGGSYGVQLPKATTPPTSPARAAGRVSPPDSFHAASPTHFASAPNPSAAGVPTPDPRKGLEVIDALTHPLRVIKGAWQWGASLLKFDQLGTVSSGNALVAQGTLQAAREGLDKIGLARLLPFLSNAIDKRAAEALTELRPDVERQVSEKSGHPVHIVWPVGGHWYTALDELVLLDKTFKEAQPAEVMKALSGISEINVKKLSVVDWFNPIKKEAATLFIQRPLEWAPGQKPMEEVLKAYFTQVTTVSATV